VDYMNQKQPLTMPDWLLRQANINAATVAVSAEEGTLTYRELWNRATGIASALHRQGIERGTRVAVLVKSGFWYAQTVHALMQSEVVLVPMNWRLTASEMIFQIEDAGATVILYDASFEAMANTIITGCQGSPKKYQIERLATDFVSKSESGPGSGSGLDSKSESELDLYPSVGVKKDSIHLTDVQAILYTSGTTGFPKGAQITYSNHLFNALGTGISFGLRQGDKWLVPMPLFHVGGLAVLMRSAIYGLTVVIHSSFDAFRVNEALDKENISIISVVPTMLQRMLALREGRRYKDSLRVVFLGGSSTPKTLMEEAIALSVPVYQSYGMTEADSTVSILRTENSLRKLGSSGQPLLSAEIAVWSGGNIASAPNVEGELIVRGPTVISGYLNRVDANSKSFIDGWFHTGDMGYLDDEGYLYVLDRRPDLIVSGGENIYPNQIESELVSHPSVLEAGVVGIEHPKWGQVPVAFVKLADDASISGEELTSYLKDRLAKYKIPTEFHFVDSLPRNASGKLMRKSLRQWLVK
jgi:o-succinylbenzoate---CoA ligase